MNALRSLLRVIDGPLLEEGALSAADFDRLLDARDVDPFDSDWIRAYDRIESIGETLSSDAALLVETIRERAYKRAYTLTENPEVAACVSDDFGLIGKSLAFRHDDPWLNALWLSYRAGRFPHGHLSPSSGSLEEWIP